MSTARMKTIASNKRAERRVPHAPMGDTAGCPRALPKRPGDVAEQPKEIDKCETTSAAERNGQAAVQVTMSDTTSPAIAARCTVRETGRKCETTRRSR